MAPGRSCREHHRTGVRDGQLWRRERWKKGRKGKEQAKSQEEQQKLEEGQDDGRTEFYALSRYCLVQNGGSTHPRGGVLCSQDSYIDKDHHMQITLL